MHSNHGRRQRRSQWLLVLATAVFVFPSCRSYEQDPYPGNEATGALQLGKEPFRVEPGDSLKIDFLYHAEWNTTMLVRSDGRMSVPFIGEVSAVGRTLAELRPEIEKRLKDHIMDPAVRLDVSAAERMVFVGGEVATPGVVTFTGSSITVLEAIMKAGGTLKESADLEHVILARVDDKGVREAWKVNLEPVLSAKVPPQPVLLRNRDVILIPNSPIDQANLFVKNYINDMIPTPANWASLWLIRN